MTEPRFAFGDNWLRFLRRMDEERVEHARASLAQMLDRETLEGETLLDVGCGSGLTSLAAHRMGAVVTSFDLDPDAVTCARAMKERFAVNARCEPLGWTVVQGSALDADFLRALGRFDVVCAWGSLHHTGDLWRALDLVADRVADDGVLYLAIYNHQHRWTRLHFRHKQLYVRAPAIGKAAMAGVYVAGKVAQGLVHDVLAWQNPLGRYRAKKRDRGMSKLHDWIDWLGGYPFETAKPEEILAFGRARGFELVRLETVGAGHGCNQYVFERAAG